MSKKIAEITVRLDVRFEDNGKDELESQAADALQEQIGLAFANDLDFDIHTVRNDD